MNDVELDLGQTQRGFAPGERLFGRYTLKAILSILGGVIQGVFNRRK